MPPLAPIRDAIYAFDTGHSYAEMGLDYDFTAITLPMIR